MSLFVGREDEVQVLQQAYQRTTTSTTKTELCSTTSTCCCDLLQQQPPPQQHSPPTHSTTSPTTITTPEFVLLRGHSGTGKTVLVNYALRPVVQRDNGYFIYGKFDLSSTATTPYAVFASAFTQFTDQLLSENQTENSQNRDDRISKMRRAIHEAVGLEGRLLLSHIIPALKRLRYDDDKRDEDEDDDHNQYPSQMCKTYVAKADEEDSKDAPSAVQQQQQQQGTESNKNLRYFQFLFCQLCLAVSTVAPVVLFLDDLQWSDTASLELLQALLQSRVNQSSSSSSNNNSSSSSSSSNKNDSDLTDDNNAIIQTSSLLVVAAYRDEKRIDDETKYSSRSFLPFSLYLNEFHTLAEASLVTMTTIHLQNLKEAAIQQLVANTLLFKLPSAAAGAAAADNDNTSNHSNTSTMDLGSAIFSVSNGNPLHAVQILNDLLQISSSVLVSSCCDDDESSNHEMQGQRRSSSSSPPSSLSPSNDPHNHVFKVADITACTTWALSIDDLFRSKFLSLPLSCQRILQVAACMGDEIDNSAIAMVLDMELPDISSFLQEASAQGQCVLDSHRGRYRFAHDRVRQAALSSIPNNDKDAHSFHIGHQLWTKSSPLFLSTNKFVVAHLLNCGVKLHLLVDPSERYGAAALNLDAGMEAAFKADFPDSSRFFNTGIEFLKGGSSSSSSTSHWSEQYALSLKLFNAAIDTEVCIQNFDRVDALVQEVLHHAHTLQDKLTAHVAVINTLGQRGLITEAVAVGIDVLRQLGEPLPQSATKLAIVWEVVKTKLALRGRSNDDLLRLHPMNDTNKLAAMHVLSVIAPYAYQAFSPYYPLLGTRVVRMCLKFGMHKSSAFGFSTFATIVCGHDRKEGYRLGSLALAIVQRWRARALLPRVHVGFYSFIHHWKCPLVDSLEPLRNAIDIAMEMGDMEVAMIGRFYECSNMLHGGFSLGQVEAKLLESIQQMRASKQEVMLQCTDCLLQFVQHLTGSAASGDDAFSVDHVPEREQIRVAFYVWGANLAYRLGDYDSANQLAEGADRLQFKPTAQYGFSARLQMDALIAVARARLGHVSTRKALKICKFVWKKMKSWEADCFENFSCKRAMVEAELRSLKPPHRNNQSESTTVMSLYDESIAHALKHGFIHEAALAYELAGNFLDRQGNVINANQYWNLAYRLYLTWGAKSKAAHVASTTGVSVDFC